MRFPALWLGALRLAAGDTGDGTTTTTDGLDDSTLVAHYTFDDEEVADDQSDVYDYDGTVGGGTFEEGGDGSGALTFDGTDDYVSFPETLTTTLIGSAARTVADLRKRTHFQPPVYHAQAVAVAGAILFLHPAVRSTVIKQGSTIASLCVVGVELAPSVEALFATANEYVPGCKVVIIAWLVAVSLVLGGIAAFKVRNFLNGVERAEAARRAGRACRSASTRFLDVETAPAPTAVFAEPAPGDRGAAYLAEPEPRKAAPSEDPPPATPVAAVAAAAFAPIDPRSSQIQRHRLRIM